MGRMIRMPLFEAEKLECNISGNHKWSVVLYLCRDGKTFLHLPTEELDEFWRVVLCDQEI